MDNKLKNWADNFKPTPQEDVWNKIIVKKNTPAKKKLSFRPNVIIGAVVVIFIVILAIVLNFLHIFKEEKPTKKENTSIQK
jgi:hypothetical protein